METDNTGEGGEEGGGGAKQAKKETMDPGEEGGEGVECQQLHGLITRQACAVQAQVEAAQLELLVQEAVADSNTANRLCATSVDVENYWATVTPTQRDINRRQSFRGYFERLLQARWKGARLQLFGSSALELFTPDSDVDLCMFLPEQRGGHKGEIVVLRQLATFLRTMGVTHTILLLSARVPILKLLSSGSKFRFKFDLCVNRPLGFQNSRLVKAYLDADSRVAPLAFVLKEWIKRTRLHNSSGCLTSYAMTLMLIHFLQIASVLPTFQDNPTHQNLWVMGYNCYFDSNTEWKTQNTSSVGELLAGFFYYYSNFDSTKQAVSIRLGRATLKTEINFGKDIFVVEDPFETDFNCTRLVNISTLERMSRCFKQAFVIMVNQGFNQLFTEALYRPKQPRKHRPKKKKPSPTPIKSAYIPTKADSKKVPPFKHCTT